VSILHRESAGPLTQRETALYGDLGHTFGSPARAYVRPLVRGDLRFAAFAGSPGISSLSAGDLDLLLEAGLGLSGHPLAGVLHRLHPHVVVGRRVLAIDGGSANLAGAGLSQTFLAKRFALHLPIIALLKDDGRGGELTLYWQGAALFSVGPHRMQVELLCVGPCAERSLAASLSPVWTPWLRSFHLIHLQNTELLGMPLLERSPALLVGTGDVAQRAIHLQGITVRAGEWFLEGLIQGRFEEAVDFADGVQIALGHWQPRAGWGLEVRGAWAPGDDRWGVLLGLRTSPAP
jgi:hypothetical protein